MTTGYGQNPWGLAPWGDPVTNLIVALISASIVYGTVLAYGYSENNTVMANANIAENSAAITGVDEPNLVMASASVSPSVILLSGNVEEP